MRIETVHTYYCEICGAAFNDEQECLRHEERENLLRECRFWDDDCREVNIDNLDCNSNDAWYIYAPTQAHVKAVNAWLYSQDAQTIEYDGSKFYFYDDCDTWVSLSNLKKRLEDMEEMAAKGART